MVVPELVADDAVDLGVDQLLGDDGALLGIGLVVFAEQFELDPGAADAAPWR